MVGKTLTYSFKVLTCRSRGNLVDTFVALDLGTSRQVLLKKPALSPTIPLPEINTLLQRSYGVLQRLKHPHILPLLGITEEAGCVCVFRPYIPEESLIDLTPGVFRDHYTTLLPQMFQVIDFVHATGYAHCDLKLTNWLLLKGTSAPRLLLNDFDLVTPIGSRPDNRLFGSPHHIAPEILRNEIVVPQSDLFSLGMMLRQLICHDQDSQEGSLQEVLESGLSAKALSRDQVRPEFAKFIPMVNELLQLHYHDRPVRLGDLFARYRTDLGMDMEKYDNELLWAVLKSRYRHYREKGSNSPKSLSHFFTSEARVSGVPGEVVNDLAADVNLMWISKTKIVKSWILDSSVAPYGDYWFVKIDDSVLKNLSRTLGLLPAAGSIAENPIAGLSARIRRALLLKVLRQFYKCAFLLEEVAEQLESSDAVAARKLLAPILVKIAEAYEACGRPLEAGRRYRRALDQGTLAPRKKCDVLNRLADLYLIASDAPGYQSLLNRAYQLARQYSYTDLRMTVLTKRLWLLYMKGRLQPALRRVTVVERIAAETGKHTRRVAAINVIGCIQNSSGQLKEARDTFLQGIKENLGAASPSVLQSLYINLGLVCFDLGLYGSAIRHLLAALKLGKSHRDLARRSWIHVNLSGSYALEGKHDEADRWIGQDFLLQSQRGDPAGLGRAYINLGWSQLRCGKYREAALNLQRARAVFESLSITWLLGRSLLFLATLHFWQGKHDISRALLSRANELIDPITDRIHFLDSKLLSLYLEFQEERSFSAERFEETLNGYLGSPHYLGAAYCLFFLLHVGKTDQALAVLKSNPELRGYLAKAGGGFADALRIHLESFDQERRTSGGVDVETLKRAFVCYRNTGLYFYGITAARQIAERYVQMSSPRLASRFFDEAIFLADSLGNTSLKADLLKRQLEIPNSSNGETPHLEALSQIGSLLNSMSDFTTIVHELLRYAVSLTGAERGALLLADEEAKQLKVEASIDCDRQGIEDIASISRGVIKTVYESSSGIVVENATTNNLTKSYRSVISLNILSIVCVPLVTQGKLTGALYLDHHSLPGLFSTEDRSTIQALADFIAVALTQAKLMRALQRQSKENSSLLRDHGIDNPFITRSKIGFEIITKIPIIANSDASVLLTGESGTGKEILAKMIHDYSSRRDGPFVRMNCAALQGDLLESELFGIERGIATGVARREGKMLAADGGTLFLDEIGDMPPTTQARLLRLLEQRQFEMVGSNRTQSVDIRFVSATNKNLDQLIRDGSFRADLLYRTNTIEIKVPPLRERKEDIEALLEHFGQVFGKSRKLRFTARALDALTDYSWPGNVRELRNLVERISILTATDLIDLPLLPPEIAGDARTASPIPLRTLTADNERQIIAKLLDEHNWNQSAVARELNIPLTSLQRRIRKYRITKPDLDDNAIA